MTAGAEVAIAVSFTVLTGFAQVASSDQSARRWPLRTMRWRSVLPFHRVVALAFVEGLRGACGAKVANVMIPQGGAVSDAEPRSVN